MSKSCRCNNHSIFLICTGMFTFFNITRKPIMQRRAKVRDGSPSCPKAFSGELKPSTMTGLSVCNVSTVGESLSEVLRLFEV